MHCFPPPPPAGFLPIATQFCAALFCCRLVIRASSLGWFGGNKFWPLRYLFATLLVMYTMIVFILSTILHTVFVLFASQHTAALPFSMRVKLLDNVRIFQTNGTVIQKCLAFHKLQKYLGNRSFSCCYATTTTKNGNRPVEEAKETKCHKRLIYKQFVQVSARSLWHTVSEVFAETFHAPLQTFVGRRHIGVPFWCTNMAAGNQQKHRESTFSIKFFLFT